MKTWGDKNKFVNRHSEPVIWFGPLTENDAGNHTCEADNVFGKDEIVFDVVVLLPPPPPILFLSASSGNSLTVSWKPTGSGGSPIIGNNKRIIYKTKTNFREKWIFFFHLHLFTFVNLISIHKKLNKNMINNKWMECVNYELPSQWQNTIFCTLLIYYIIMYQHDPLDCWFFRLFTESHCQRYAKLGKCWTGVRNWELWATTTTLWNRISNFCPSNKLSWVQSV